MKPNKTFKMSSTTKTMLATIVNKEQRDAWRRAMIDAELCAAVVPKTVKRDNNAPRQGTAYTQNSHGATPTV